MSNRLKLTNRAIEKFPPHDADSKSTEKEYSDSEVPGLKLLVGKNGSKKFLLRYTYRGRKRAVALGQFGPLGIAEARELANQQKGLVAQGLDPKQEKQKRRQALTLNEFFYEQYAKLVAAKKRSERNDLSRYKHHIHNPLGNCLIDEITTQQLLSLQNDLTKKLSNATNNRVMALLRHIFNTAERWGLIERSPAKNSKIKLFREDNRRTRLLTDDQLRAFFNACDHDENYYVGQYFKFLLLTGARRSEAANAKWEHINLELERPTWTVPTSKTGSYVSYLNRLAVELLSKLERIPGHPFVFPGGFPNFERHWGPIVSPTKAFKRVLKRAGIEGSFCIHQTRYVHSALISRQGGSASDLMFALNHSSLLVASRYSLPHPARIDHTGNMVVKSVEQALNS